METRSGSICKGVAEVVVVVVLVVVLVVLAPFFAEDDVDDSDANVAAMAITCLRITAKGTSHTIIVSDIHRPGTLSNPGPSPCPGPTRQDNPGVSIKNEPKTRNCCTDPDEDDDVVVLLYMAVPLPLPQLPLLMLTPVVTDAEADIVGSGRV